MKYFGRNQYTLDIWAMKPVCPFDGYVMLTSFEETGFQKRDGTISPMRVPRADCPHCHHAFLQVAEYWHDVKGMIYGT